MEKNRIVARAAEGYGYLYTGQAIEKRLQNMGRAEMIEAGGAWSSTPPARISSAAADTPADALGTLETPEGSRSVDLNILSVMVANGSTIDALTARFVALGSTQVKARARAFRDYPEARRVFNLVFQREQAAKQGVRS